jgi:copper chaperone CopZ
LPGVEHADVNFALGNAHVTYAPGQVDVDEMVSAVQRAGYLAGPAGKETAICI